MSHAPKQRALEAYAAERLSPRARAQVERHLARCPDCSELLCQLRAYAQLRQEAAELAPPLLDWERLEAALDAGVQPRALEEPPAPRRRAGSQRARGKWIALAWPALAVAATLVIGWIGLHGSQSTEQAAAPGTPAAVAEVSPALLGRVTLVTGGVWLEQAGVRTPLALDSVVREGARLVSDPGAVAHVVLADGTGFALAADSGVRLRELRAGGIQLDLERGSLASQVRKLTSEQHYLVTLGALSARVRGTRFVVEQAQAGSEPVARVSVHEGQVEVAKNGQVLALLSAGQSFEQPAPRALGGAGPERAIHAIHVSPALPSEAWGSLRLPPMAELRAWIVAGDRIAPQGGLQLRLPRGANQLSFEDARGQLRSITLELQEQDTQLEPGVLARLVAPKEARAGVLEPEQIAQVIRAGVEPLRRCYERGLRVLPTLAGKLTLSMRVSADGRVQRAEPQSHQLPTEIARCISQEAMRLVFPKPQGGGAVSFDVPLNLKSH